jgi:hypothetical protein
MREKFKKTIQEYPEPLFYNSTGSTEAYKLCIRHLSASVSAGLASQASGYIYPHDVLYIVDLENEKIEAVTSEIKLVKLRGLK